MMLVFDGKRDFYMELKKGRSKIRKQWKAHYGILEP